METLRKLGRRWHRVSISVIAFCFGMGLVFALHWPGSSNAALAQDPLMFWRQASFPVENFQAYTSAFGYRTSPTGGGGSQFHYGLDLAAPQGSFVRNWWNGKVIEVSDHTTCGTSAVIRSGQWEHRYCHMSGRVEVSNGKRYLVDPDGGIRYEQGQDLPTGVRLGRVGMTGRTTGPHLHWMLKYDGNWVDPGLVLRAMYDAQRTG
ncbi:M23 family metallopeptidase [Nodosilinea sp. LEGE 07088]|jgi:murein DD-endopeptidase MepM/ murein hydrolase activator NlpD|nr:M23 family metallopeptidase [Nodosilinea sp. LEGE 07088]MBE9135634.1 M23 family metallopeptidase [Nodosilinea sp. LEGE 07088]